MFELNKFSAPQNEPSCGPHLNSLHAYRRQIHGPSNAPINDLVAWVGTAKVQHVSAWLKKLKSLKHASWAGSPLFFRIIVNISTGWFFESEM
jgi:hypothetical protein